jgi:tRNA threonylcarbamoyladenosine biosynthesis protein TsaB
MPTILAIETSTRTGSVALARDGVVLSEASFIAERSHNAQIFAPLRALLEGSKKIEGILVGVGPGSYTGVRIGIACGLGLSLARGVPFGGMPSVCALDEEVGYWVIGDARRGKFFRCRVEGGHLRGAPVLSDQSQLSELSDESVFTFDDHPPIPGARVAVPSAGVLARRGSLLPPEEFASLGEKPIEPIYLAPAFVTTPRKPGKRL